MRHGAKAKRSLNYYATIYYFYDYDCYNFDLSSSCCSYSDTTAAVVQVILRLLLLYLSSVSVEPCDRVEVVPETDKLGEELKLLDDGRISRHHQQQPFLRRPLALLLPGGRNQQLVQLGLNGGVPGVEPYERHLTVAGCFQAVLPPPTALYFGAQKVITNSDRP